MRPLSRSTPRASHLVTRVSVFTSTPARVERVARIIRQRWAESSAAAAARLRSARCAPSADRCGGNRRPASAAPPRQWRRPSRRRWRRRRRSRRSADGAARPDVGITSACSKAIRMLRRMRVASSMRFRPGAKSRPFVMAEIGVHGAGRDHQIVVGHVAEIGVQQFLLQYRCRAPLPSAPWRCAAGAGCGGSARRCPPATAPRSPPVEQRLEAMVVLPVDDDHVGGRAPQRLGGLQPAKAGPTITTLARRSGTALPRWHATAKCRPVRQPGCQAPRRGFSNPRIQFCGEA